MATVPLTAEQIRERAKQELDARGQLETANGRDRCRICNDTPESHVHPVTKKFLGCGAARKGSLTGQPWMAEGRYELLVEDFPKRAIRSEQERIAYSIVKSLARANWLITSARLSDANPTWNVRDAYRLLQALTHRGILKRIGIDDEEEATGEGLNPPPGTPLPPVPTE